MKSLHFIIPNDRMETGVVQEEIRFGYFLCWFGGQPTTGRLISIEDMTEWHFYIDQSSMLQGLSRLKPRGQLIKEISEETKKVSAKELGEPPTPGAPFNPATKERSEKPRKGADEET